MKTELNKCPDVNPKNKTEVSPILKAVIFDLDGTICNTIPLCIAAFKKAIEPLAGRSFSDEEIIATFGPSEEGTIQALIPQFYQEGMTEFLKYYQEMHDMCPEPFDGISELIYWLKANNIIVALVTGKGHKSCKVSLTIFNLSNCFEMIETGSPLGQRKPEGMQAVLNYFHLNPNEAIYVGDTVSDILSARKVNIPIISAGWAATSNCDELLKYHPDELFTSVDAFRCYLENILG